MFYGGGFYDRLLKKHKKSIKIGVSIFEPIDKIFDIKKNDMTLDYCITPFNLYINKNTYRDE